MKEAHPGGHKEGQRRIHVMLKPDHRASAAKAFIDRLVESVDLRQRIVARWRPMRRSLAPSRAKARASRPYPITVRLRGLAPPRQTSTQTDHAFGVSTDFISMVDGVEPAHSQYSP
jgi:hypothetical protein